jgi:uncharacterized membrane protein/thiol-disulfide isomerase/thioredoxin
MSKSAPKTSVPRTITSARQRDWYLIIPALMGLLLTLYLLLAPRETGLVGCPIGGGCDLVQRSRWSHFFGLPLSGFGAVLYGAILAAAWWVKSAHKRRLWVLLFSGTGFGISLFLSYVTWRELQVTCPYCLLSLCLLAVLTTYMAFEGQWRETLWIGTLCVLLAGGAAAMMQREHGGLERALSGQVDPYLKDLASHLNTSGVKFFGAYWCPHCQQQKALFGAAAKFLPYVECSPHGPQAPQATECLVRDIKSYPTWLVGETKYAKLLSIEQLARLTAYSTPPPDTK